MTREEAIEIYNGLINVKIREAFEFFVPELRGSKDERIRKHIIEILDRLAPCHWDGNEKSECIAYLEKQKEKKPEWSEEDELMRTAVIQTLETLGGRGTTGMQIDWLKSLPERFNLQPKQEWSENYNEENIQTRFAFYTYKDDPSTLYLSNVFVEEASRNHGFGTRILRAAEKVAETLGATTISMKVKRDSPANDWYRKNGYGYLTFEGEYDWREKNLEYFKPKKEVEWSKEDEEIFSLIITHLLSYAYSNNPIYRKEAEKCVAWLKSLRPQPHWKPSEEQMKVFFKATPVNLMPEELLIYKSLYDDIEKLL